MFKINAYSLTERIQIEWEEELSLFGMGEFSL